MQSPMAFLQTDADTLVLSHGPLTPLAYPRPGAAAFFVPAFAMEARDGWWLDAGGPAPRALTRAEWRVGFPGRQGEAPRLAWRGPDEPRFRSGFVSLRERLTAGVLRKGVPVTVMRAPLDPARAAALFERLLARVADLPPALMGYGFFRPAPGGVEFLIGATPELLFELLPRNRLVTTAVAGTRAGDEAAEALEASPKDRDEHQSVVEDLLAQVSGWGAARASRTEVRRFGTLQHLAAEVRLDSRAPLDFEAVARRLHPTPALGVYPRGVEGSAWLASIDPAGERGRFGAPFGLRLPSGSGRCLVAIRCVQYRAGCLEIWAGCGVVPMSRYEDEWEEVRQKMHAVRTLWGV
jgi:menaquinone-specific isochorismate synthase